MLQTTGSIKRTPGSGWPQLCRTADNIAILWHSMWHDQAIK